MTGTILRAILAAAILATAAPGHTLPEDRDQPIHITADRALRDEKNGVTVYSGNVQMRQGSMEVEADELTIYHTTAEADKIVAVGTPARMRQQPEPDEGLVHAEAGVISYFRNEDRVHLQTDASIEQDGAIVTGDSIDYLILEQLVKAESDQSLEGNKVVVVIPPSMQQRDPEPEQAPAPEPESEPTPPEAPPTGEAAPEVDEMPQGDTAGADANPVDLGNIETEQAETGPSGETESE